jgi:hypothetical protein
MVGALDDALVLTEAASPKPAAGGARAKPRFRQ